MYSVIQQKWNMWFGFAFFFIIQMWLSNTCYFIMCTFRSFNVIYHQCLELLWVPFKSYRTRFFFFFLFLVFFFISVWVKCFSNQSLEMQMESPSVWLLLCAGNIDKCFIDSCWVRLPVVILKPFYFYFLCMDVLAYICAQYLWRPEKGDGSPLSGIKDCSEASCRCWECNLVI